MHNILFLGPQGSGKGTQSVLISNKLGIPIVAVGKLFREEIAKNTGLGKAMEEYILRGDRVPSLMVNQVMSERIGESDTANGMILDGYPRTVEQAKTLDKILGDLGRKTTYVLYLKVSDDESLRRLAGRRVCSNTKCEANYHIESNPPKKEKGKCDICGSELIERQDDTPEAIRHRLDLYHKDTEPLIEFYENRGILHRVDGQQPIEKVSEVLLGILES